MNQASNGGHTHDDHDHQHGHAHSHSDDHPHGNAHDRSFAAMWRYTKLAPRMLRSEVNTAVVDLVAPRAGETVVDIGAGMGAAVSKAAAAGASVIAVDPTPYMRNIMSARRLLSRHRKAITVVDGAAEALPLAASEVDAVWAVNTMHHWTNPRAGIAEIARVLGPGGRAVLVDENFANPRHPDYTAWSERHGADSDHGFSMVNAAEFGDMMKASGLVDIVADERDLAGRPVIAVQATMPW